jgi:GNAT superfamily N-acetyltransferase
MTSDLLELALDWAAAEGWNPGIHDAHCFFRADPEGFFMGFLGDEPVGSISAVSYNGRFGFIGLYIVKAEHRGKGYGLKLWHQAVEHLSNQTMGLDGVVERQLSYARSGFVTSHRNIRFEWAAAAVMESSTPDPHIVALREVSLVELTAYDSGLFPEPRGDFLGAWVDQPGSVGFGYRGDQGELAGYALARPCRRGYKLGPLFCDSPRIAEALLNAVRREVGDAPVYLDIPEPNSAGLALAQKYRMTPVFETARMYTPLAPALPLDRVFGITTFELG